MKLFIVRHGETDWNIQGRFQGQIDIPLNSKGMNQAKMLADRLKNINFSKIITSPLERAQRTAFEIYSRNMTGDFLLDDRLIEINHGSWEGCYAGEIAERWPEMLSQWHSSPDIVTMPGKNGESLNDIKNRITPFLNELYTIDKDINILIASHDAIIKVLLCEFLNTSLSSFWRFQIANCSISLVEKIPNHPPQILLLGDTYHLGNTFNRPIQKGL
ncbi:MAG: histidine phosphatase family protein [Synergistaceae bacterium]